MSAGKRPRRPRRPGPDPAHLRRATSSTPPRPTSWCRKMRASFWVIAPLLARMGEAQGFAARRLRDRHAAGRSVDHGAGEARRARSTSTAATSSRRRPDGLKGAAIDFPKVSVGGTHVALMAATLAQRHDRDRERRARARDRRPRRLPEQDGRADRRHRHVAASSSRACDGSTARAHTRAARPHRDRHLCDGGGDDRRRRPAGGRARRNCCRRRSTCCAEAGAEITATTPASASAATAAASRRST